MNVLVSVVTSTLLMGIILCMVDTLTPPLPNYTLCVPSHLYMYMYIT